MKIPNGLWKKATVVLTGVVLLGAAVTALQPYRFWAWASDLEQVAEVSYSTAIKWEQDNLRGIELSIDKCMANQDCPSATLLRLKRQEQDSRDAIEKFKRDHESLGKGG